MAKLDRLNSDDRDRKLKGKVRNKKRFGRERSSRTYLTTREVYFDHNFAYSD